MKSTRIFAHRVELPRHETTYKWSGGKSVTGFDSMIVGIETETGLSQSGAKNFPDAKLNLSGNFTAVVKYEDRGGGTLFSQCIPTGKWSPDAKALFIRGGRFVYDIGWLGAMNSGGKGVHFSGPGLREHAARWVEKQ